jgi:uncharacterized cupredoxin-like copper-binding protein
MRAPIVSGALVLAAVCGAGAGLLADADGATGSPVVVTLRDGRVVLSSGKVLVGTVPFTVVNQATTVRRVTIGAVKTSLLKPGRSATVRVVFRNGGSYAVVSAGPGGAVRAMLRVTEVQPAAGGSAGGTVTSGGTRTCAHPVSTTVNVTMSDGRFAFSQTGIPCGPVTFVMANVGLTEHSLDLFVVESPTVQPGATARWVVNLLPGDGKWECGMFGHDDIGELGNLIVS